MAPAALIFRPDEVLLLAQGDTHLITSSGYPLELPDFERSTRYACSMLQPGLPLVVVIDMPFVKRRQQLVRVGMKTWNISQTLGALKRRFLTLRIPDAVGLNSLRTRSTQMIPKRLLAMTLTAATTSASAISQGQLTDLIRGVFGSVILESDGSEPTRPHKLLTEQRKRGSAPLALSDAIAGIHSGSAYLGLFRYPCQVAIVSSEVDDQVALETGLAGRMCDSVEVEISGKKPLEHVQDLISALSFDSLVSLAVPTDRA